MKNPILAIGVILMGLFLYQVGKKEKWGIFANEKLISTSCRGVLIRLEKKVPGNWKVFCEGNNLAVEINEVAVSPEAKNLRTLLYRQLANHMSFTAKIAHQDILEKVDFVRFRLTHPKLRIDAVTEGKFIVKLATLETTEHLMAHFQSTVQVKETLK